MQKWQKAHDSFCADIENEAQKKLNRLLTGSEQQAIHGIMSLQLLEAFESALQVALTVEDAEQWLRDLVKTSEDLSQKPEERKNIT